MLQPLTRGDASRECMPHAGNNLPGLQRSATGSSSHRSGTPLSWMDVWLCGPSWPVVLFREGRLAKLREELVEAI